MSPHEDSQPQQLDQLRHSHALPELAGRMAGLGGWSLTIPDRKVQWSDELRLVLECPAKFAPDADEILSWCLPASREIASGALADCLRLGHPFDLELDMVTFRKRQVSVRVIGQAIRDGSGRIVGAHGALLDQTARKLAEGALRESEERFRNIARATADAIWEWDAATDTLWWSDGIRELFGVEPGNLSSAVDAWAVRVHPEELESAQKAVQTAINGGSDRWQCEYRFRRSDGSYAQVLDRGFVIRKPDGSPRRMAGGMSDLTLQHRADSRIREQAALLNEANDAIVVRDMDDKVTFWNRSAERIFGWTAAEALGRPVRELLQLDPMEADRVRAELLRAGEWTATLVEHSKTGHPVWIDGRWTLMRDTQGRPTSILGIKTDVTRRRELEAELQ
jgi:PAS domain S-box-containing protein